MFAAATIADTAMAFAGQKCHRLGFADAYLVASAERSGVEQVLSFDCAIDRIGTVRRIERT